ncbi:PAS domain-containing sensor histidine kinase [Hymenobacter mucosus]|uniref:PAS domain-containing sensor histidine kinase n=1 Tax=Hymenobacter mucosus TaxID=1411120 RepID=UPI00117AF3DD|nr:PAS domain-containing sensor histidine kinase [Hymenobacter mucosus]
MSAPSPSSADVATIFPAEELLQGLFDVSLDGIVLYKPVYGPDGSTIIDLAFVLLNTAAQQMLQLPAHPTQTHLQRYPQAQFNGVFEFYCSVFETGQPGRFELRYQADGLNDYYYLSARRVGQGIVVSFTDTTDFARQAIAENALQESRARISATEAALHVSLAREQVSRAEAETQRARLHNTFMQAPAMITIFEGPDHVFSLVNPLYQQLVGPRALLGKPIREAMPELAGQPIFDLLDTVYRTGVPYHAFEMLVKLDHTNTGELGNNYYNFVYQPSRDTDGNVDGVLVFAYEVTAQVEARSRVEQSETQQRLLNQQLASSLEELAATNEELAASNEELQAANEEIRLNNDELFRVQLAVQSLNMELEARVRSYTRDAREAQQEAEQQRARLEHLFMQAPAAICILHGPELVFELVNPGYQQLFPGRELLGISIGEAIPELTTQPIWNTLRRVYETGESFEGNESLIQAARHEGGPLEDIYFNFVYQPRYNTHKHIDGVIVFAFEVTEQVLARQKVAAANAGLSLTNQQLTRINQDLDNFVYTASHDLKQPVNNMAGVFEEFKRTATFHDPEAALLITMFEGALNQIHNTIQGLTEVVQVERRSGHFPLEDVALQPLVTEVLRSMHNQISAANATFELNFTAVPMMRFARLNAQSILYNLLSNALKYAHPDRSPHVHVYTELTSDTTATLVVADNGLGLDVARYGADLFQMFRRFHDHVPGSGMGLYLVNRIVRQAGGNITVESKVGSGTTFRIVLPNSIG